MNLKRSFPPVIDENTRLLVLGSLPGEESLARSQYYANPRNQFWRLMGEVLESDLVCLGYEARLQALGLRGVGLWDTIGSALRTGSLDAAIRDHSANDLEALVQSLPQLRAVAFNGGTSARVGEKQLNKTEGIERVALPSSSPAYTMAFEGKRDAWLRLRDFL